VHRNGVIHVHDVEPKKGADYVQNQQELFELGHFARTFLKRDKSAAKSVDTPLSNIPSTPQPAIKSSKAAARDEAAKPSKGKPVTKVAEGVGGNVKLLKPKTAQVGDIEAESSEALRRGSEARQEGSEARADGGGVGVVDRLRFLREPVTEVQFGGKADRTQIGQDGAIVYANKRAEMWGLMRVAAPITSAGLFSPFGPLGIIL
jgi:hypothetical protein